MQPQKQGKVKAERAGRLIWAPNREEKKNKESLAQRDPKARSNRVVLAVCTKSWSLSTWAGVGAHSPPYRAPVSCPHREVKVLQQLQEYSKSLKSAR